MYGLGSELVALDGDWVGCHMILDWVVCNIAVFLIGADKVAVREDALQPALLIGGHYGAGFALLHGIKGNADGISGLGAGELVALSHYVGDTCEQLAAKAAVGVQLGKIFWLKTAGLKEHHG